MAGAPIVPLKPIAAPHSHAMLPSIPLTIRKSARSQFPHQAGRHRWVFYPSEIRTPRRGALEIDYAPCRRWDLHRLLGPMGGGASISPFPQRAQEVRFTPDDVHQMYVIKDILFQPAPAGIACYPACPTWTPPRSESRTSYGREPFRPMIL